MLKKKLTKAFLVAVVGALAVFGALALSACGGGGASSSSSSSGAESSAASSQASSSSSQQAAADLTTMEDGTLTVITSADYPPMENMEGEEIVGFDPALIREIGERLGLKVEIKNQAFDTLVTSIAGGNTADVAISAITIDEDRAKDVDFTDSYYDSNLAIVVMNDADYKAKEDVNGDAVGAQSGTSGESWIKENLKKSKYTPFQETPDLLQALRTGKVKAAVYDAPVAEAHVAGEYDDCKILETIATGEQYGIIVNKDNPELTAAINTVLAEIVADGTYDKLITEYLG